MPYLEPSRPRPEDLIPPNGATSVEISPSLIPTMPYSRASLMRQARPSEARMPTVSELFQGSAAGSNAIVNNDPNLRPERATSGELATAKGAV